MKTALFVRNSDYLSNAIDLLNEQTELLYVVHADSDEIGFLKEYCGKIEIECLSQGEFVRLLKISALEELDFILSYYYQQRLTKEVLCYPRKGCVNFHPAPLPKYRGVGNYSKCILDGLDYWGVSAHLMDEEFDNGPLIKVLTFHVLPERETYLSLESKTRIFMFELLVDVIEMINGHKPFNDYKETQEPYEYLSKRDIGALKEVKMDESNIDIDRKIRAFWRPPFHGANIRIGSKQYTLVSDEILRELAEMYKEK